MCVCVRVRACVNGRVFVRARARVCVFVCVCARMSLRACARVCFDAVFFSASQFHGPGFNAPNPSCSRMSH